MSTPDLYEMLDELHGYLRRDVAAGFSTPDTIVDGVVDLLADEYDITVLRFHAERMTHELIERQRQEQIHWPPRTDCDRLDHAFRDLEARGIVSRQHYSCCGTCGTSEIYTEMMDLVAAGEQVRGYTFYHMQDTESAVEGGGLYLNYGAAELGADAAIQVGHEIVTTLEAHGLTTHWDGSWNHRIFVRLEWKRRLPLIGTTA